MLLLIAVANAPYWLPAATTTPEALASERWSSGWVFVRTLLIDQREYPLFSLLLGFGCAAMVAHGVIQAGVSQSEMIRRIRLRGGWMMLFGAVHALVFQGDVLGAYGLVLVLFAGVITRSATRGARGGSWVSPELVFWSTVALIPTIALMVVGGLAGLDGSAVVVDWGELGVVAPLYSLGHWGVNSVGLLFGSVIVPCTLLGTALRGVTTLSEVSTAKRRLMTLGGLLWLSGAFAAMPHAFGRIDQGYAEPWWALLVHVISGATAALGLLLLLAGLSGYVQHTRFHGAVGALGRRSMTGYLLQTMMFAMLVLVALVTNTWNELVPAVGLVAGVIVYFVTLVWASRMELRGRPGQADALLRRLVGLGSR